MKKSTQAKGKKKYGNRIRDLKRFQEDNETLKELKEQTRK